MELCAFLTERPLTAKHCAHIAQQNFARAASRKSSITPLRACVICCSSSRAVCAAGAYAGFRAAAYSWRELTKPCPVCQGSKLDSEAAVRDRLRAIRAAAARVEYQHVPQDRRKSCNSLDFCAFCEDEIATAAAIVMGFNRGRFSYADADRRTHH